MPMTPEALRETLAQFEIQFDQLAAEWKRQFPKKRRRR